MSHALPMGPLPPTKTADPAPSCRRIGGDLRQPSSVVNARWLLTVIMPTEGILVRLSVPEQRMIRGIPASVVTDAGPMALHVQL